MQAGTGARHLPHTTRGELASHTRRSRGRAQVSFVSPDLPSYPLKEKCEPPARRAASSPSCDYGADPGAPSARVFSDFRPRGRGTVRGLWVSQTWRREQGAGTRVPFPGWSAGLAGGARAQSNVCVLGPAPVTPAPSPSHSLCFWSSSCSPVRVLWGIPGPRPPERWGAARRARTRCPDTGDD